MYDTTMTAIVVDGHLKSALASVRSLGQKDITVVCGAERQTAMACHSKYVRTAFVYTSPKKDQQQFIEDIITQAKQLHAQDGQKPVLYCFSDATAFTVARAYNELKEYVAVPLPSLDSFEIAADKLATYTLAQELSVPTIPTHAVEDLGPVNFPAVVKNRHSIVWKDGRAISGSASFVFSKDELVEQYRKVLEETGEAPLIQKFVQGEEFGIEMVCEKGEVLMNFAHRRIRSLSPRGGAAVVKETAKQTETVKLMEEYAETLVGKLSWTGPVMVEFKVDATNGRVFLMEINGRFWGSLPLAVEAGADFPSVVYGLAQGRSTKPVEFVPAEIRTRHFLGDLKWVLSVFFSNDRLRSTLYPSRLRAMWDFKKEIFLSKGDVFNWRDMKPSFMEYIDILRK
jgi:predicted ATP-grasp superfamily ATP-dependent carboligase